MRDQIRVSFSFAILLGLMTLAPSLAHAKVSPDVALIATRAVQTRWQEIAPTVSRIQFFYRLRFVDLNCSSIAPSIEYAIGDIRNGRFEMSLICFYPNHLALGGPGISETTIAISGRVINGKAGSFSVHEYPNGPKYEERLQHIRDGAGL